MTLDRNHVFTGVSCLFLACNLGPSAASADTVQLEPVLVEMTRPEAILYLQDKGLSFDMRRSDVCALPDTVVATIPLIPAGGINVAAESIVTLIVTTKVGLSEVPNVVGISYSEASTLLRNACFSIEDHVYVPGRIRTGPCGDEIWDFRRTTGVHDTVLNTLPRALSNEPWASVVRVTREARGERFLVRAGRTPPCP